MKDLSRPDELLIIGIDGGASKVSGWVLNMDIETGLFSQGSVNVEKRYADYPSYDPHFTPVDLNTQLSEMKSGIKLQEKELKQAESYKQAALDVVSELLKGSEGKKALVGIGMPGLKTPDKRGIAAIANGPRMPDLSDFLEQELENRGQPLGSPIAHLGSDADYCGLGEEYSAEGMFRDVENAYYLGGGTGVADAMKLSGETVTFDEAKPWIAKAWEMKDAKDISMERYTSASGIQWVYSNYSKIPVPELNSNMIYSPQILQKALENEEAAFLTMTELSDKLAMLLFERINTVYGGWSGLFAFVNPNRPAPEAEHKYRGILLDRIIIGQRLGDLLEESKETGLLWKDLMSKLGTLIKETGDEKLIGHYLEGDKCKDSIVVTSLLREAPAVGAGVDAFLSHKKY